MDAMGSRATYTTVTSDNRLIVGRVGGIAGLYVVAGFSGSDFHLAPSIGEGIAQMIAGAPVTAFDQVLSPEQFHSGPTGRHCGWRAEFTRQPVPPGQVGDAAASRTSIRRKPGSDAPIGPLFRPGKAKQTRNAAGRHQNASPAALCFADNQTSFSRCKIRTP
ncbi:MAG: hypothetical protein R3E96_00915 [Planctomycetota bacterium]